MRRAICAIFAFWPATAIGQVGAWEQWFWLGNDPFGTDANEIINMVHVFNGTAGRVLVMKNGTIPPCLDTSRLWNVQAGAFSPVPNCNGQEMFCQGHSALADGRVLHAGGVYSILADLYDPFTSQWNQPAAPPWMTHRRWYPTCTTLGDGRVVVFSGSSSPGVRVLIPELYTPSTPPAGSFTELDSASRLQDEYPWMFLLPNGHMVDAGPTESRMLATSNWTWRAVVPNPSWPVSPPPVPPGDYGSAAMYEPGRIVKCGGWPTSVKSTWVVNLSGNPNPDSPPNWMVAGDMHKARRNHNLVLLPDGTIVAVGGNRWSDNNGHYEPVLEAELFDPASGKWELQPSMTHRHDHHSTAMLLPDGRVVVAGGDGIAIGQRFRPPYINNDAPRSAIVSAPAVMQYGQQYTIGYYRNGGAEATKVCLMRLAAVTHSFDQDQRRVPLEIPYEVAPQSPLSFLAVTAPGNGNIAPPGYYMLFILNEYAAGQFAPCEQAAYVRIGP